MIFGSLMGRFVCGWLCPFGLVQDLLHKIPFIKKIKKVPFDRYLRYLKYVILVVFVIAMPLLLVGESGYGSPWFCKLICPSGTLLGGIPLVAKIRDSSVPSAFYLDGRSASLSFFLFYLQ